MNAVSPDPILPATLVDPALSARWVAWQTELPEGRDKPTKVPYSPRGNGKALADKAATWGAREAAETRAARLPMPYGVGGIGLELGALGDGRTLAGIDLDTCKDSAGTLEPWAIEVVARLDSYTETSPSGSGVKVFALLDSAAATAAFALLGMDRGRQKLGACFKRPGGDHPPAIEFYAGGRFFAVTERHLAGTPAELRAIPADDVTWLLREAGPALAAAGDDPEAGEVKPDNIRLENTPSGKGRGGTDKSRSALAFRKGCELRRGGASFEGMVEAMRLDPEVAAWVADKGEADGQRELRRIWDKADPATCELVLSGGAPLVSARQFLLRGHTLDGARTLLHQNGNFYSWDGSHYSELAPEEMRERLYAFLDRAKRVDDRNKVVPFDPTKNKVANVLEAAAAEAQLARRIRPPAWLGNATNRPAGEMIACSNVLLHLPTRETRAHTPDFFTLNALAFPFEAKAPAPSRWLAFLKSIWPDDDDAIDTLQEMFGLCLTGETKHQKAFLIVGPKRSGKGTIARVLTELLGAANVAGPTLSSLAQNFGLAPLIGKRVAIISDARLSGKADQQVIVERLLSITGEDGLTIDRKFRDGWTGKLDARFVILTNEMPRLTDSSGALSGRFIILTMARSFYGREDLGLSVRLMDELPGILLWAIEGWERLAKRGYLVAPASSEAAQREMDDLGSPVGAFLRECCTVAPEQEVQRDVLYRAWCRWCGEQGREHPGNAASFGRDLTAAVAGLNIIQHRNESGNPRRFYAGVSLLIPLVVKHDESCVRALCSLPDPSTDPYFSDDPGPLP